MPETNKKPPSRDGLRRLVIASLRKQGFRVSHGQLIPPANTTKEDVRSRHCLAVQHKVEKARKSLARYEPELLPRIADGREVQPKAVRALLVEVQPDSKDELLFRYASLHWSIPVSSGYGRRLRFLVLDQNNDRLIGIIGLGDPVFGLAARDQWVGWDSEARRLNLRHVVDAFVLGAVPPYSMLLGGKLVALLAASNEVRAAFKRKYGTRASLISRRPADGRLALITTTSALGRSSVYNRLKYRDELVFRGVGYTSTWGEIFFANGLYASLHAYAEANFEPTAKQQNWGTGFRNRREVIRKCLRDLGFPDETLQHCIEREVFVVPLARNTPSFLRGDHSKLMWHDRPCEDLGEWFKQRWLLPRAEWDRRYLSFESSGYRLWGEE